MCAFSFVLQSGVAPNDAIVAKEMPPLEESETFMEPAIRHNALHSCNNFLICARIPFRLRLCVDDLVKDRKGKTYEVAALFSRSQQCRKGQFLLWGTWVYLGGKPLSGADYLVVASSHPGNRMEDYRNHWSIECLFQVLKGRGFHLEETCVIELDRLCRLFGFTDSCLPFVCLYWSFSVSKGL
jgi:hypothetical protein